MAEVRLEGLGQLDRLLSRGYRRFGWNLLVLHAAISWLLGLAVVLGATVMIGRVDSLSTDKSLELGGLLVALVAACATIGLIGTSRMVRPIAKPLSDGRDLAPADPVWMDVHRLPFRISRLNAFVAAGAVPPALVCMALVAPLSVPFLIFVVFNGLVAVAFGVWFGVSGLQLLLRPLIRDLDRRAPARPPPAGATPVRIKQLVVVPTIALWAGIITLVFTLDTHGNWGKAAQIDIVALIAIAVLVLPAAVLLAYSTLEPLNDLLRATERLKRGDFQERVPELSGDEYGVIARSFNEAMEGLAERQRLAVANERLLDEVRSSRARIVAASDAERRRVERNIHDGAQQRLVALSLDLSMLEELAAAGDGDRLQAMAGGARVNLLAALDELRELARGLHPSVLVTDGLAPALEQLATRAPLPVDVVAPDERFPEGVESSVYFVVSEAVTNIAKYAHAAHASVSVQRRDGQLVIEVADDGVGGASPANGSGLAGLADRVAALDGDLALDSPQGGGTKLTVRLPLGDGKTE